MENLLSRFSGGKAFVLGVGGGGDVVTAVVLRRFLSFFGLESFVGGVVWERFPVDPFPGPISLKELNPVKVFGESLGWVNGETTAYRGGVLVKPQLTRISKYLGEDLLGVDLWMSPLQIVEDLVSTANRFGVGLVVGVDVGGDVLAVGGEKNLWSPLADQVMLTVLAKLKKKGYETLLAVHGLGVDGELNVEYLLKRISQIAKIGGYLGARGLNCEDAELLEKLVKVAETESSLLPLKAFKGEYGEYEIRLGTRKAMLTPLSTVTFLLDPLKIFEASPMAKAIVKAKNLEEANKTLNQMGIYTELDLEKDEYNVYLKNKKLTKNIILKIRKEGIKKLRINKPLKFK